MFDHVESFHRPTSVREALQLLARGKGRARVVAGGTDLVLKAQADRAARILIDITRAGLTYIRPTAVSVTVGATVTMTELEESAVIRGLGGGILSRAAASCATPQIRNMATIGGNMANGSPAADLAAPLLVLEASVVVAGTTGRRTLALLDYLATTRNQKGPQNLLVELTIPRPRISTHAGWSFQKLGRTAGDISLVNAAAGMQLDARGKVKWVRLALCAVAPLPMRATLAEACLTGRTLDAALIADAGQRVTEEVSPITDQRATAGYRREMSRVLAMRALRDCAAQAGRPV